MTLLLPSVDQLPREGNADGREEPSTDTESVMLCFYLNVNQVWHPYTTASVQSKKENSIKCRKLRIYGLHVEN